MGQRLSQHQQTEAVIDVRVRDEDCVERDVAGPFAWVHAFKAGELVADVRARVDDAPALAVRRDGDRGLTAMGHIRIAPPCSHRELAAAVPLRQSPAGTRSQNMNLQEDALSCGEDTAGSASASPSIGSP